MEKITLKGNQLKEVKQHLFGTYGVSLTLREDGVLVITKLNKNGEAFFNKTVLP